jgi:hypothetical protein
MRIITAVFILVTAGVATASAQQPQQPQQTQPQTSWAMDHGRAADAAAAAQAAAAAAKAKEAAIAAGLPLSPSQITGFSINGDNVILPPEPLTPEQQQAEAEARELWQARCRPSVVEDADGLRRTRYAAPDCDLSRFNTAGN